MSATLADTRKSVNESHRRDVSASSRNAQAAARIEQHKTHRCVSEHCGAAVHPLQFAALYPRIAALNTARREH